MRREEPRVCANCKWAEINESRDSRKHGGGCWCHLNPGAPIFMNDSSWCSNFALTIMRERRDDLPYPPYQVVSDE